MHGVENAGKSTDTSQKGSKWAVFCKAGSPQPRDVHDRGWRVHQRLRRQEAL